MGISIPGKDGLCIETGPWFYHPVYPLFHTQVLSYLPPAHWNRANIFYLSNDNYNNFNTNIKYLMVISFFHINYQFGLTYSHLSFPARPSRATPEPPFSTPTATLANIHGSYSLLIISPYSWWSSYIFFIIMDWLLETGLHKHYV